MTVNIQKEVYGHGQAIVLIHGWAMHTGIWRKFAQQLAKQYKVICLNLPGHGLSDTVEPYTLDQIVDVLIEQIDETEFCLLGWSLGATVSMAIASHHPDRVKQLIVLAGNPRFIADEGWPGMRVKLLEDFSNALQIDCSATLIRFLALQVNGLSNGKEILKDLKLAVYECNPPTDDVLQSGLQILKQADLRDQLLTLQCAICIIQGDKDTLVPLQTGYAMKKIQPECQLNIIVGAGHVPFLSHQAKVMEIINRNVWAQY